MNNFFYLYINAPRVNNGAMTEDNHKGTSITYNSLNLPMHITVDNEHAQGENNYVYTTTGVKLRIDRKKYSTLQNSPIQSTTCYRGELLDETRSDYVGNFIYEDNTLKRILVDKGYIENNNYYFYVRDHLGNNRIVADSEGSVLQSVQYYPFGLEFAGGIGQGLQPYKYGGKELDSDHNLNLYDFSARYFDPAVPRFTSIDPHAENYYSWSPYVYCYNNPLRFVDPTGKDGWDIFWGTIDGVVDNLSLPFLPTPNNTDKVTSASDYNTGRSIGDIASIAMGVAEIFIGGNVAGRGVGVAVASGGSGIAAAGTGVAVGTGIMGHGVNTIDNALKKDGRMSEMSSSEKSGRESRKFGGGVDTKSTSPNEALRKAKDQNGIPRSQQPNKTIKPDTKEGQAAGLREGNIKQYEYTNSKGERITIRQDAPHTYPDGGKQKGHYNAGKTNADKLKQHHYHE